MCYGKVRGEGGWCVCGWRGWRGWRHLGGGLDVFKIVRLSCGRLGVCGRGKGGGGRSERWGSG